MAWLAYLNSVLNLNKPLNDDQIELCAKLIAEEYYAVTFADLSLIFRRVVTGQMGELYEALSIPKILSWFAVYFDERCNAAGEMSAMEHEKFTKATSSLAASKNLDRRFRT